jgi:hypothetical protein
MKMLKAISRASFQRSSATHFGTLSAEVTPFFAHGGSNVVAEKRDFQSCSRTNGQPLRGTEYATRSFYQFPTRSYALILPHLEFLSMPHHLSPYEPGQALEFVHFPNTGMVSLVIATEDGKTVDVGEVGREGFAGIQEAVGINRNQVREIVQIAGDGFRVRSGALKSVL